MSSDFTICPPEREDGIRERSISSDESRLAELLYGNELITREQLVSGLVRGTQDGRGLLDALVSLDIVSEEKLARALQRQANVEGWDPSCGPVHEQVIATFPAALAIHHRVFPVAKRRDGFGLSWCVATVDPTNEELKQRLQASLCTDEPTAVVWFVSTRTIIDAAIRTHYGALASVNDSSSPAVLARIRIAKAVG